MLTVASRSLGDAATQSTRRETVEVDIIRFDDDGMDANGNSPTPSSGTGARSRGSGNVSERAAAAVEWGGLEMAALNGEKSQKAARRLHQRMMKNNPVHAYGRMVQCSEEDGEALHPYSGGPLGVLLQFRRRFSICDWLPRIDLETLRADLIAGVTVGVMVIPQSMAYANIAGLPYIYGMYSACVPTLVYGFLGQSRQLAIGPVAVVSLIIDAGLRGVLDESQCPGWHQDSDLQQYEVCPGQYANAAMLTAATVGLMQIAASLLKLGFLVSFLGHPVVSGFTSGVGIIIGLSQLKHILGFDFSKSQYVYVAIRDILGKIEETKPMCAVLGVTFLIFLIVNKRLAQRNKKLAVLVPLSPFICCSVGTLLLAFCEPLRDEYGVSYVGEIPKGVMPVRIAQWDLSLLPAIMPTAITSCLISYMESIAIGKNLAAQHGYEIDAVHELFSLGVANLVGSVFSCYPVTGSFSRSAVNNATGARTQLSGMVTAVLMFITLLVLTPAFYYLPKFALAAIAMNSVIPLIAFREAKKLYSVKRNDFVLWIIAFLGTLFLGVLMGIYVAVAVSLLIVISESVRPQIAVLWRIPGTTMYRSMKQESSGTFVPNVLLCRIGCSMYFANASFIKDTLLAYISELRDLNPTEYVVLEMTPVMSIDSTAVHLIRDFVHDFRKRGIQVGFAMVGNRVDKTMRKSKLRQFMGEHWFFPTVNDAVHYCLKHQQAKRHKSKDTPIRAFSTSEDNMEEATPVMSQEEEAMAAMARPARPSNELGFCNSLHHAWTAVFISFSLDGPMLVNEIIAIFRRAQITVVKAEVEPLENGSSRHKYMVQNAKHKSKLKDAEVAVVRDELLQLFATAEQIARLRPDVEEVDAVVRPLAEQLRGWIMNANGQCGGNTPVSVTRSRQVSDARIDEARVNTLEEALMQERNTSKKFQQLLEQQSRSLDKLMELRNNTKLLETSEYGSERAKEPTTSGPASTLDCSITPPLSGSVGSCSVRTTPDSRGCMQPEPTPLDAPPSGYMQRELTPLDSPPSGYMQREPTPLDTEAAAAHFTCRIDEAPEVQEDVQNNAEMQRMTSNDSFFYM